MSTALPISTHNTTTTKPNQLIQYTLDDINRTIKEGFVYKLPESTISIIQSIADQVGAPEYVKTPHFIKNSERLQNNPNHNQNSSSAASSSAASSSAASSSVSMDKTHFTNNYNNYNKYNNKRNNNNKIKIPELTDQDWDNIRKFQATVLLKKEGICASIDQIRKHLNKITTKTYTTLKEEIINEINKIIKQGDIETPELLDEVNKIGDAIFTIASGNGFYSSMYAKLYKELMDLFPFMKTIFQTNFENFRALFNKIDYCDPSKDYDAFCNNNKANEKRRALGLFYVNLMLHGIIEEEKILEIIVDLQKYILTSIDTPEHKQIVDELSEILFILITTEHNKRNLKLKSWADIINCVKQISTMKTAQHISVTNKTIFKHMDILDII